MWSCSTFASCGRSKPLAISLSFAAATTEAWHFTHASVPTKSLRVGSNLVGHQPGWATHSIVLIRSTSEPGVAARTAIVSPNTPTRHTMNVTQACRRRLAEPIHRKHKLSRLTHINDVTDSIV